MSTFIEDRFLTEVKLLKKMNEVIFKVILYCGMLLEFSDLFCLRKSRISGDIMKNISNLIKLFFSSLHSSIRSSANIIMTSLVSRTRYTIFIFNNKIFDDCNLIIPITKILCNN